MFATLTRLYPGGLLQPETLMKLLAVNPENFASQRWLKPDNYAFAVQDAVAPLVVQELPKALLHLPVGFIPRNGAFALVAIQGLQQGRNWCVDPDGRWLSGYVPAVYRSCPFSVQETGDGSQVLCFDVDCGLLTQTGGEPFYEADGQLAQSVREIVGFLQEVVRNRASTERICAILQRHQLIQPWPIKIQTDTGEHCIDGLYQVDEAALNTLAPEAFQELRAAGALPMAYCQLLSIQHLPKLAELAKAQQLALAATPAELKLGDLLSDNGTLDFSGY